MNCPHCGKVIPSIACSNCGEDIPEKSLFCCKCGHPVRRGEPVVDSSERIPCRDGSCIGTINERGVCSVCGKPYA